MTDGMSHEDVLGTLARMEAARIKPLAEAVLPQLGAVEVIHSRTGLVMCPMRDTVQGTDFHLGEVLVAEAHVTLKDHGVEGYGMVTGRDLEQAMAMALIDGALAASINVDTLTAAIRTEQARQAEEDRETLRRIEATRVDMETF